MVSVASNHRPRNAHFQAPISGPPFQAPPFRHPPPLVHTVPYWSLILQPHLPSCIQPHLYTFENVRFTIPSKNLLKMSAGTRVSKNLQGGPEIGGLEILRNYNPISGPPKSGKGTLHVGQFPPDNSRGGLNVGGRRKPTRKQSKIQDI